MGSVVSLNIMSFLKTLLIIVRRLFLFHKFYFWMVSFPVAAVQNVKKTLSLCSEYIF